jgi:hypothetical protein
VAVIAVAALGLPGYARSVIPKLAAMTHKTAASTQVDSAADAIRPFHVHVPEKALIDLRRRLAATRLPDQETVADPSQGVQAATMRELVRYWHTDCNWWREKAKLNALPEFVTTIDGVRIHFIHVRSKNPNALRLVITHGWPGSIFELLDTIGPLTDPVAYGGAQKIRSTS